MLTVCSHAPLIVSYRAMLMWGHSYPWNNQPEEPGYCSGLVASCQTQDHVKAPGKSWGRIPEDRGRDDEACWQHPGVVPFPGCLMLLPTPAFHSWSLKPGAEKKPRQQKHLGQGQAWPGAWLMMPVKSLRLGQRFQLPLPNPPLMGTQGYRQSVPSVKIAPSHLGHWLCMRS